MDKSHEWNAEIYHEVSVVQEKRGQDVISRDKWIGNEIVMDAGCGTGRVTRILSQKVSKGGRVYAVHPLWYLMNHIDSNMISHARKNLKEFENVIVIQSELTGVKSSDVKISLILLLGYTSYYNMNFVATYSLHGQKNNYKQANNG